MKTWSQRGVATRALGALTAAVVATACGPDPGGIAEAGPSERIVLVVIDTLRRDHLSVYGAPFETPNIDALARSGQAFGNAFSSFHQTTMSMASLFTGRTPSLESDDAEAPLPWNGRNWCGLRRFATGLIDFCIPEGVPTLAEDLRTAGHWTAGVSTNALMFRPAGYDRGFDAWVEVGSLRSDQLRAGGGPDVDPASRDGKATNSAVAELLDGRPNDRFFLYVHYMDVHDHAIHPDGSYESSVKRVDAAVGDLVALLEDRGLRDGATLVLVSDHGERFRERHLIKGRRSHYGNPSFEEHLQVPLIISPARFDDSDRFLRSDGVHELVRALAGLPADPLEDTSPDELFLSERRYQTLRQGRWKIYRQREGSATSLVDLESDPGETRDVSAQHPDVVARMIERVDTLARDLATAEAQPTELSEEDMRRLRLLGYTE